MIPLPDKGKPSHVKDLARGFCLGVANIIPGVSGGTFLLIFGIYQRVFDILGRINLSTARELLCLAGNAVRCPRGSAAGFMNFMTEKDFFFLLRLALGAAAAILGLSGLMKYLLLHHFAVTYALFFGLILVSLAIPARMFRSFHWGMVLLILLGMGLTVGVSWGVNPYDKVKFKSDRLASHYLASQSEVRAESTRAGEGNPSGPSSVPGRNYSAHEFIFIAFCGGVAICAMVLPGVSGSLVLILMGAYFDVISALSDLRSLQMETVLYLAAFGLGIALGGLLFARLVSFVLAWYYDATMAVLTGLMLGSLYALWPFKEVVVMARQFVREGGAVRMLENVPVYTNINRLPGSDDPVGWAVLAFIIGCCIMVGFVRADTKDPS